MALATLEDHLQPVKRICERWAVGNGSGLPAVWADTVTSKPPPLPDDIAIKVDAAIMDAPTWMPKFFKLYFCTPQPNLVIAMKCGFRHADDVPTRLREALQYLFGVFKSNGVLEWLKGRVARSMTV